MYFMLSKRQQQRVALSEALPKVIAYCLVYGTKMIFSDKLTAKTTTPPH